MNTSDSPAVLSFEQSRRKLLKNASAIAASAAIASACIQGCKSDATDQKSSTSQASNACSDQNEHLNELAQKLKINVSLLKQHRSFLVFWLMLTTNPNWLDPNACELPKATDLETDLGGDLKAYQIQAVFDAIKCSDEMRTALYNAGAIFNDNTAVKSSSGFTDLGYSGKTCPPGLEIILSLYEPKSTFTTANPSCSNEKDRRKIKLLKSVAQER